MTIYQHKTFTLTSVKMVYLVKTQAFLLFFCSVSEYYNQRMTQGIIFGLNKHTKTRGNIETTAGIHIL